MKYTKTVPYFKKGDTVKKRVEVGNTGKTKEEIKAEALSHQTREKGQQAMDKEAKLAAENRKKASASSDNISKPKVDLSRTATEKPLAEIFGRGLTAINSNKSGTVAKTRGQAFQEARKRGDKEFEWQGKRYHTRTAEEEAALRSGDTAVTVTNVGDTNTEDKSSSVGSGVLRSDQKQSETPTINYDFNSGMTTTPTPNNTQKTNVTNTTGNEVTKIRDTSPYSGPSIWADRDRIRNIPQNFRNSGEAAQQFFDGVNLMYEDFGKTTPGKIMNNPTQSQHLLGALPLILWGKIKKHTNPMFQQGGTINKFQRGNSIKNTDYSAAGERRKRIEAYRAWKNSDVATQRLNTLFDNTKRPLSVSTSNTDTGEIAKIRPHWIDRFAGNSNTIVRKVSPNLQDTTYAVDDGVRRYANYQDGSYRETMPIIGPGRYTGSTPPTREALQNQFERYYKKEGGTIDKLQRGYQQGGSVEQLTEESQEELMLDFAVRYLVTVGVPEEDIMDPQGNLNPEHQQELEQVFQSQEIAWSDYAASPDEYMQQFIGNLQAQTQIARKGAKLKRLSQIRAHFYGGPIASQVTPPIKGQYNRPALSPAMRGVQAVPPPVMRAQYNQEQEQRQNPSLWDLNKRAFSNAVDPYIQKADSVYGARKDALVDRYHNVGNRVVDSFNTRKDAIVDGYNNLEETGEKAGARIGRFAGRAIKAAPRAYVKTTFPLVAPIMEGREWLQRRKERRNPPVYF